MDEDGTLAMKQRECVDCHLRLGAGHTSECVERRGPYRFVEVEYTPVADAREAAFVERQRWLPWAAAHACCRAGLVSAPDPCPWHDADRQ